MFPHRVAQGIAAIEALGYRARTASHALNHSGYVSDTPEHRAADIHELFVDPAVKMVLSAIGGDHACHLLPLLDFDLIAQNPKILMGFSDSTVLNVAVWQKAGLVTFNGPALLTDFAEYPRMLEYTREAFLRVVTRAEAPGELRPAETWTEEFLAWETRLDQTRPRAMLPSAGWTWLKEGQAQGRLLGGCLESLQHLRGTPYWPDWRGAIFFFETSEEKPEPETVDSMLMDYENMGVFEQINGMLVGRPMLYNDAEKQALRDVILERTRRYDFPVITDMDFGHTAPQMTLPLGCLAEIDTDQQRVAILESAVIE